MITHTKEVSWAAVHASEATWIMTVRVSPVRSCREERGHALLPHVVRCRGCRVWVWLFWSDPAVTADSRLLEAESGHGNLLVGGQVTSLPADS